MKRLLLLVTILLLGFVGLSCSTSIKHIEGVVTKIEYTQYYSRGERIGQGWTAYFDTGETLIQKPDLYYETKLVCPFVVGKSYLVTVKHKNGPLCNCDNIGPTKQRQKFTYKEIE